MLIIRPYEEKINNIIETINEFSLLIIMSLMFFMSSEAKWLQYEDLLFSVIGINSIIVIAILFSKPIVNTLINSIYS